MFKLPADSLLAASQPVANQLELQVYMLIMPFEAANAEVSLVNLANSNSGQVRGSDCKPMAMRCCKFGP